MKHLFTQLPVDIQDLVCGFLENSPERPHWVDLKQTIRLFYTRHNMELIQPTLDTISSTSQVILFFNDDEQEYCVTDGNGDVWIIYLDYLERQGGYEYVIPLSTPIGPFDCIVYVVHD
jgi:hypothetical protein